MGYRKLYNLFSWNPFTWYSSLMDMYYRAANKGIEGNMVGEGIVLGGVLLISRAKGVIYQYNEQAGLPVPVHDILAAIKEHNASSDPSLSVSTPAAAGAGAAGVEASTHSTRDAAVCTKKGECSE